MQNSRSSLPQKFGSSKKNYLAMWTQFNAMGEVCLRIITDSLSAPQGFSETIDLNFKLRASKNKSRFPVNIWEAIIPLGQHKIEVDGVPFFTPSSNFTKIALIGDTGCRPDQSWIPSEWPFKKIMSRIVQEKPDLIIHLGDYNYRHIDAQEKNHPTYINLEEGDNWLGWKKEFFQPTADLNPMTPWIFVRGNQECYDRAFKGWKRFLDPYPYIKTCRHYDPPYVISFETVNLIIHDSSIIDVGYDKKVPLHQFNKLKFPNDNPAWLFTHRPPWGIVKFKEKNKSIVSINEQNYLQKIFEPYPNSLTAIFSGHIHAFQAIKPLDSNIWQYVMGNGGVSLEKDAPPRVIHNAKINNKKIQHATSLIKFGYTILEYLDKGWKLTAKDLQGKELASTYQL